VHVPVLVEEVARWLTPERGGVFVDCTVGLGGHSRVLLTRGAGRVVGIDRDPAAIGLAREALSEFADRVELVHADYRELGAVLDERGLTTVAGILADLGVSSLQLDAEGRGFSFRRDEPLDMRMDTSRGDTAADLLARVDETELADVIYRFGEERNSRRIARALVRARESRALATTGDVADIVRRASRGGRRGRYERIDPATRTFQALRIWVNRELEGLDAFIETAAGRLEPAGRFVVITFQSLEDRVVKHTFRRLETVRVLTKRPVVAGDDELARNPRARSAKLRAVERT
jgi:16S rRNA (cytosine1402-N4)-methyltransferase